MFVLVQEDGIVGVLLDVDHWRRRLLLDEVVAQSQQAPVQDVAQHRCQNQPVREAQAGIDGDVLGGTDHDLREGQALGDVYAIADAPDEQHQQTTAGGAAVPDVQTEYSH